MDTITDTAAAAKNRSYEVRRTIPTGTRVRLTASTYKGGPIPAGTEATVRDYTNAGFRGIEASLTLADGRRIHGVHAGLLEAI